MASGGRMMRRHRISSIPDMIPSAIQIFELCGSTFLKALEYTIKGRNAGEAGAHCYLGNRELGLKKKLLCFLDPSLVEVIIKGHIGKLLK